MPVKQPRGPQSASMQNAVRAAIAQHGQDRQKVVDQVAAAFPTYERSNITRSYRRLTSPAPAKKSAPAPAPAAGAPATPAKPSRKVIKVDGYSDEQQHDNEHEPTPGSGNAPVREPEPARRPGGGGPAVAEPGPAGPITRPVERVAPDPRGPDRGRTKKRRSRSGPAYGHLFGW